MTTSQHCPEQLSATCQANHAPMTRRAAYELQHAWFCAQQQICRQQSYEGVKGSLPRDFCMRCAIYRSCTERVQIPTHGQATQSK